MISAKDENQPRVRASTPTPCFTFDSSISDLSSSLSAHSYDVSSRKNLTTLYNTTTLVIDDHQLMIQSKQNKNFDDKTDRHGSISRDYNDDENWEGDVSITFFEKNLYNSTKESTKSFSNHVFSGSIISEDLVKIEDKTGKNGQGNNFEEIYELKEKYCKEEEVKNSHIEAEIETNLICDDRKSIITMTEKLDEERQEIAFLNSSNIERDLVHPNIVPLKDAMWCKEVDTLPSRYSCASLKTRNKLQKIAKNPTMPANLFDQLTESNFEKRPSDHVDQRQITQTSSIAKALITGCAASIPLVSSQLETLGIRKSLQRITNNQAVTDENQLCCALNQHAFQVADPFCNTKLSETAHDSLSIHSTSVSSDGESEGVGLEVNYNHSITINEQDRRDSLSIEFSTSGSPLSTRSSSTEILQSHSSETNLEGEFEVEEIMEHRRVDQGPIEYLVKWMGYTVNQSTWECEDNLTHAPLALKKFQGRVEKANGDLDLIECTQQEIRGVGRCYVSFRQRLRELRERSQKREAISRHNPFIKKNEPILTPESRNAAPEDENKQKTGKRQKKLDMIVLSNSRKPRAKLILGWRRISDVNDNEASVLTAKNSPRLSNTQNIEYLVKWPNQTVSWTTDTLAIPQSVLNEFTLNTANKDGPFVCSRTEYTKFKHYTLSFVSSVLAYRETHSIRHKEEKEIENNFSKKKRKSITKKDTPLTDSKYEKHKKTSSAPLAWVSPKMPFSDPGVSSIDPHQEFIMFSEGMRRFQYMIDYEHKVRAEIDSRLFSSHSARVLNLQFFYPPPVLVINDVDLVHPPLDFTYITRSIRGAGVQKNKPLLSGCNCKSSSTDPMYSMFCCMDDRACECTKDYGFAYTLEGTLKRNCTQRIIRECSDRCGCVNNPVHIRCLNRVVQRGRQIPLEIYRIGPKLEYGVRCPVAIPSGTFVEEYVGEIVTMEECEKRPFQDYLFDLDVDCERGEASQYTIDARHFGNTSRFFNHSCEPNLRVMAIVEGGYVDDDQDIPSSTNNKCLLHRLAFFAAKDIQAGKQLTFDYAGLTEFPLQDSSDDETTNHISKAIPSPSVRGRLESNFLDNIRGKKYRAGNKGNHLSSTHNNIIMSLDRIRCMCKSKKCRTWIVPN